MALCDSQGSQRALVWECRGGPRNEGWVGEDKSKLLQGGLIRVQLHLARSPPVVPPGHLGLGPQALQFPTCNSCGPTAQWPSGDSRIEGPAAGAIIRGASSGSWWSVQLAQEERSNYRSVVNTNV